MILPIYLYGQPVLRKKAEPVDTFDGKLRELIANMYETMYDSDGIGLAAPQVGISKRLMVIDGDCLKDSYPECAGFRRVFINPEILERTEDTIIHEEGCLSLPNIHEKVERPTGVKVRYIDGDFQEKVEELNGFAARIFQHEYDHIEGILFIDHISPLRKRMVTNKLNNILKGKVRCSYRTVVVGKR